MSFKPTLSAIAVALTIGAGTVSAASFPDFVVDPTLSGATSGGSTFTADKITGNYVEYIAFTGVNTFAYSLRWVAGQFVSADGTNPLPGFVTGLTNSYGLYAEASGTGTFSTVAGVTTFVTNPGGSIQFTFDKYSDGFTSYVNSGAAITDVATLFAKSGNALDKDLLATGAAIDGLGKLDPTTCSAGGINCGSFGQQSGISLNADGKKFFTDPIPFYTLAFNSGQLNNFDVGRTQVINGSLDIVFNKIPEPSALALAGLALLGLGLTRRRKASK